MLQVRMHRPPRRFPIDTLRFLATSTRHHTFFPFFLFLFLFFLLPSLFLFLFHNGIKRVACCSKRYITFISLQFLFDIVYIHFFVLFRLFRTFCLWKRYSKRRVTSISLGYRYGSLPGLFIRLFSSKRVETPKTKVLHVRYIFPSAFFFSSKSTAISCRYLNNSRVLFFSLTSIKYSLAAVCFLNRTQRNVLLRSNRKLSKRYKHRSQITRRVKSRVAIFPKL